MLDRVHCTWYNVVKLVLLYYHYNQKLSQSLLMNLNHNFLSPLNIPESQSGRYSVQHKTIPAGEAITVISMRTALFTGNKPLKIMYDLPVYYHYLKNQNSVLMSDVPQEQIQHEPIIAKCKGKVLIGGLGLGYIATKLSEKKSVTEIIVIEKSKAVINLVWPYLDLRGKGNIIHADIFKFLKENQEDFDYIYLDIWSGDSENVFLETVLPLRKLARKFVKSKNRVLCWQEEVMRGQIRTGLQMAIQINFDEILNMPQEKFNKVFSGKTHRFKKNFWAWARRCKPSQDIAFKKVIPYVNTLT